MANFIPHDYRQALLLPMDLRAWVPDEDLSHFVIESVERVDIGAFKVTWRGSGKASKIKSVRHDRALALSERLANGTADPMARAEAADGEDAGVGPGSSPGRWLVCLDNRAKRSRLTPKHGEHHS